MPAKKVRATQQAITQPSPRKPVVRFSGANWHLVPVFPLILLTSCWFATNGTFELFWRAPVEWLETVYDSLAHNLVRGRVDVAPESIAGEAFVRDSKTYSYFPPAPALPRMLLNAILPDMAGTWARLFSVLMLALSVGCAVALYREYRITNGLGTATQRRWQEALLATVAGFGSTALLLVTRSYMHHESMLWASAFALLTALAVLRFWRTGSLAAIVTACVCAAISFFSRATAGIGAVLLIGVIGLYIVLPSEWAARVRRPETLQRTRAGVIALTATSAITAMFFFYNWARFGSPLQPVPLRYHAGHTKEQVARINGTLINPLALPQNFYAYWFAPNIRFVPDFPRVHFGRPAVHETDSVNYDIIEPEISLLASYPVLVVLSLIGIVAAVRTAKQGDLRFLIVLSCLFAGASSLLIMVAISERYKHDFYPFAICASALGLAVIDRFTTRVRRLALTAVFLLGLYSIYVGLSLSFVYQRDVVWGIPEQRRYQLREITASISQLTAALQPVTQDTAGILASAPCEPSQISIEGNRVKYFDCVSSAWRVVRKPVFTEFVIYLPEFKPNHNEPLVAMGTPGAADIISIHYDDANSVRVAFDHWGTPGVASTRIRARPGSSMRVAALFDTMTNLLTVHVEGIEALKHSVEFYGWESSEPVFGLNPLGASMDERFRGTLRVIR